MLYREVCVQKTGLNTNHDPASIIWGMVPTTVATTRFMILLEMDSLCTVIWRLSPVRRGLLWYLGALKIRVSRALGKCSFFLRQKSTERKVHNIFWLAYFRNSGKRFFFDPRSSIFFCSWAVLKKPPLLLYDPLHYNALFNLPINWCVSANLSRYIRAKGKHSFTFFMSLLLRFNWNCPLNKKIKLLLLFFCVVN